MGVIWPFHCQQVGALSLDLIHTERGGNASAMKIMEELFDRFC